MGCRWWCSWRQSLGRAEAAVEWRRSLHHAKEALAFAPLLPHPGVPCLEALLGSAALEPGLGLGIPLEVGIPEGGAEGNDHLVVILVAVLGA